MSQNSNNSRSKLSGSLLDRIRAQRGEGEQAAAPQGQMIVGPDPMTPSQISIPNYGPPVIPATMQSTTDVSELGSSSMMSGGFGLGGDGMMNESLLGPPQPMNHNSHYSMTGYFQTFVMDVYGLFRSLPILAQVVLLVFLIVLVIKWI